MQGESVGWQLMGNRNRTRSGKEDEPMAEMSTVVGEHYSIFPRCRAPMRERD